MTRLFLHVYRYIYFTHQLRQIFQHCNTLFFVTTFFSVLNNNLNNWKPISVSILYCVYIWYIHTLLPKCRLSIRFERERGDLKSQAGVSEKMGGANFENHLFLHVDQSRKILKSRLLFNFFKYNKIWHNCTFPSYGVMISNFNCSD